MIRKSFIFSLLACLSVTNISYAGCLQTFGVGSAAKGQAEAVSAKANDPYAVYYNAAGLSQLERPTVTGTYNLYDAEGKIKHFEVNSTLTGDKNLMEGMASTKTNSNGEPLSTPTMGYAMPINRNWSFGVAAYSPYGMRVLWKHNPYQNPAALYAWESTYYRTVVNPSVAYKINEALSIGFGTSLGHSISHAGKTLPVNPSTMVAIPTALKMEAEDSFNYSFNAGVLYKLNNSVSMGLTYRSVTYTDFEGDVYLAGKKMSEVEMKYDHPASMQGGVRFKVMDDLEIETDLVWTEWNVNDRQVEKLSHFVDPVTEARFKALNGGSLAFDHNRSWNNTIQYKLGTEWTATKDLTLRAGYTYDPTPVPDDTFDIGWPDTDRSIFNLGFGYVITQNWSVDSALQYVRSTPMRKVSGSTELNHNYGAIVQAATGGQIPASTVNTKMEMEGLMVAYSLSLNYKF